VTLVLVLVLVSGLVHMRIGMKEIIEDYIHDEGTKIALVVLNTFFVFTIGAACVFALLKIAFGG
jgi:succinate dehydrogenase / fumarate reductase membrane anchor subunit